MVIGVTWEVNYRSTCYRDKVQIRERASYSAQVPLVVCPWLNRDGSVPISSIAAAAHTTRSGFLMVHLVLGMFVLVYIVPET